MKTIRNIIIRSVEPDVVECEDSDGNDLVLPRRFFSIEPQPKQSFKVTITGPNE